MIQTPPAIFGALEWQLVRWSGSCCGWKLYTVVVIEGLGGVVVIVS